jgi:hypothetical protein
MAVRRFPTSSHTEEKVPLGSAFAGYFQRVFPVRLTLSVECRDENLHFVHIVKLFSALTSEIRRVTGQDRDRHLIRPLNATLHGSLCPGSRFAVVSGEAVSDAATTESSV